jgi:hypothetical protein
MKTIVILLALFTLNGCREQEITNAQDIPSPSDHADYVVLGKSINHRQEPDGSLSLLNTVFFGEIFQTKLAVENGTVTNGYLIGPGEAEQGLQFSEGDTRFLAGIRQLTIPELTKNFPDTTYYFNFDTPDGNIRDMPVTFKRNGDEILNPDPIKIFLHQNGIEADPNVIDPDQDLVVRWSPFEKGEADPRGIIDDMIYVIMGDCMGVKTVHSGPAFATPSLTYRAKEFVIAKEALNAGQPYQVEVEQSNMDTDIHENIEIIVTYAASSFLDIKTTGENKQNPACPAIPFAMDGGQTDRTKKP